MKEKELCTLDLHLKLAPWMVEALEKGAAHRGLSVEEYACFALCTYLVCHFNVI